MHACADASAETSLELRSKIGGSPSSVVELFRERDEPTEIGLPHLLAVGPVKGRPEAVSAVVERLAALIDDPTRATDKSDVVEAIGGVIPDFRHRETGRSLDDRA